MKRLTSSCYAREMSQKRILYVDDEEMNLYLFELQIEDYLSITTAISGEAALKILEEENGKFDYILSDIRMPIMDGYEFLELAKGKYPLIPRYVLTAFDENEQIRQALKSGLVKEWFMKPIDDIEQFLTQLK